MKSIYKYVIDPDTLHGDDKAEIHIPAGARILSVINQREDICLYAQIDTKAEDELWHIWVHGTGHSIMAPETAQFVGTVSLAGGSLIFHIFAQKA